MSHMLSFLRFCQTAFKVVVLIYKPPKVQESFGYSIVSLLHNFCLCLVDKCYHIVAFIYISLLIDKVEQLFSWLLTIWIFSPANCRFLLIFFYRNCLFLISFQDCLYILYMSTLSSSIFYTYVFPSKWLSFHFLNGVFDEYNLKNFSNQFMIFCVLFKKSLLQCHVGVFLSIILQSL